MFGWGGQRRSVGMGVLAEAALRTSRVQIQIHYVTIQ